LAELRAFSGSPSRSRGWCAAGGESAAGRRNARRLHRGSVV